MVQKEKQEIAERLKIHDIIPEQQAQKFVRQGFYNISTGIMNT